ncbi:MAG: YggT family protein [Chloroflexi bacterium]|nr:YggT family protein [Chloroflexota bacterium]
MADLIDMLTLIFTIIIFARIMVSWMVGFGRLSPYSPLAKTIIEITEPILAPVRNLLPPAAGFDFSPMIVIIGIQILGTILKQILA